MEEAPTLNEEIPSALRLSLLPGSATAAALEFKITGSDKGGSVRRTKLDWPGVSSYCFLSLFLKRGRTGFPVFGSTVETC